jgi:quaternary ammonium compound-resistance protein SugE
MAWAVLILSGVLEAVWATALDRSDGFSKPVPTIVFGVALALSMAGLAYAMRSIPLGTAYAVWVGIGAAGTALIGILVLGEPRTAFRLASLALILLGVIGLRIAEGR